MMWTLQQVAALPLLHFSSIAFRPSSSVAAVAHPLASPGPAFAWGCPLVFRIALMYMMHTLPPRPDCSRFYQQRHRPLHPARLRTGHRPPAGVFISKTLSRYRSATCAIARNATQNISPTCTSLLMFNVSSATQVFTPTSS